MLIIPGSTAKEGDGLWANSPRLSDQPGITEWIFRAAGAALQIVATWMVVHALPANAVGVYFRGFVISLGFAALLRANYEIYAAYHIVGGRAAATGISDSTLVIQLGKRVLLRSSLVCGVLLVIAADIDIQAPRLQPALETYLPFVLAIPWVSLSSFVSEALRAANRTLYGTIVGSYVLNLSMILAVGFAPPEASIAFYAWVYFGGTVVGAGLAVLFGRFALKPDWRQGDVPIAPVILRAADERWLIAIGRTVMLWGPVFILSVVSSAEDVASYAVAARTAMIVDFILPALNLSGGHELATNKGSIQISRRLLMVQLGRALIYSTVLVSIVMALAPNTLRLYGGPYDKQLAVYIVLIAVQWVNSVGRPAVRFMVRQWDVRRIGSVIGAAAVATILTCVIAINRYGVLAPAIASLVGALLISAISIYFTVAPPKEHRTI